VADAGASTRCSVPNAGIELLFDWAVGALAPGGLRVDRVDERQHLGDDGIEFARNRGPDIEPGERLDESGVLVDLNSVLAREPHDFIGGKAAADRDDLRRLAPERIVMKGRGRTSRHRFARVVKLLVVHAILSTSCGSSGRGVSSLACALAIRSGWVSRSVARAATLDSIEVTL